MLDEPKPRRARLVPLIAPRLSAAGLTICFAFDSVCPNAPPGFATSLLAFAPMPVGAVAGSCRSAGRSRRWPLPCSMPSWRTTGEAIASRVVPPGLSWAERRGRKICRANGLGLVSPSLSSSRLPNRRGCTVMLVSIASKSLPPPAASSRAGGREPSRFAGKVEPPPAWATSSARPACVVQMPISAIARRWTTILKPALPDIVGSTRPPVPRRVRHGTSNDRRRPETTSAAPARRPRG